MSSSRELQYLGYTYRNNRPTTGLLNSIFMTTVSTAARSLVSVASTASTPEISSRRWSASDHLRFMSMMMTWLTLWVLRVFLDYLPNSLISSSSSSAYSYCYPPFSFASGLLTTAMENVLVPASASASSSSSTSSTALVKYSGSSDLGMRICDGVDEPSVNSLGRALCHALTLMNEIPITSRKYHFAMGMAEKIMEDNARSCNVDLLDVNRAALALSFARTTARLQDSLKRSRTAEEPFGGLPLRVVSALPLGGYVASYVRGLNTCISTVRSLADMTGNLLSRTRKIETAMVRTGGSQENEAQLAVEKLAEELLWMTDKLRRYGAVDEGIKRWSYASGLASLALTAAPRVQGLMVKISALLIGELAKDTTQVPGQVTFRLLANWLPLFSHARNGLAFPVLTGYERVEVERAIEKAISTLPALDQEIILTNWLQDYSLSASEWPNLQPAYDRWCDSTRQFLM
ncbi:BTB/POZ domain-containing protein [Cardamine amara subsp. amara]|uniref:BTB/POZ domain-containing protein n=1 Tax=Cardamine amara subsp. amara TaxID=228776 RepID=A0ABD0ZT11_CARAN